MSAPPTESSEGVGNEEFSDVVECSLSAVDCGSKKVLLDSKKGLIDDNGRIHLGNKDKLLRELALNGYNRTGGFVSGATAATFGKQSRKRTDASTSKACETGDTVESQLGLDVSHVSGDFPIVTDHRVLHMNRLIIGEKVADHNNYVVASEISDINSRHAALMQSLDGLRQGQSQITTAIAGLRTEMAGEMAGLRAEMAGLRAEMAGDMAGLRADMTNAIDGLRKYINEEFTERIVIGIKQSFSHVASEFSLTGALAPSRNETDE